MAKWLYVVLACLLLTACKSNTDQSPEGQLRSNQALIMTLQNAPDLQHLYFFYPYGNTDVVMDNPFEIPEKDKPPYDPNNPFSIPDRGLDMVQIGELNLMLHNVGGAATAGGLFISGYDPNLIDVGSRLGQNQIRDEDTRQNCYNQIRILGTGQYSIARYCEATDDAGYGFNVRGDTQGTGIEAITGSLYGQKLNEWADKLLSVTGKDVDFFTKYGIFDQNSGLTCGVVDGKAGCSIALSSSNYNPQRASYGRLLINLMYADIQDCKQKCRLFPPNAPSQVLSGVTPENPLGDVLYYDYDIFLNRKAWNPLVNDAKQTFQITACYLYTTTVTPSVCVDPDPTTTRSEPCTTSPITFKEPQGAPIKVTRIEQRAQSGATAFTIHVEHVGTGQIYLPGHLQECGPYNPTRPNLRHMDAVQLLDARIQGDLQQLRCLPDTNNGEHIIRLQNGKGQITCLYPVNKRNGLQSYRSSIALEFGYVYQNIIRQDVIIHRS